MEKTAIETIERHGLIDPRDGVVVGLSGGADSTALLLLLCALREQYELKLHAVHINHQLRGAEADRDQAFSQELCQKLGVSFHAFRMNVAEIAAERGQSFEMAGRELRYACFESERSRLGYHKIAVAHHRDDQGETMLLRLIRGSGLDGLVGIRPSREGVIIRPLLMCSRKQIEAYCVLNQIEPMMDHTNLDSAYSRNFLRNEVIPMVDAHFGGSLNKQLSKASQLLAEDADFIQGAVEALWNQAAEKVESGCRVSKIELMNCHPAIRGRLVRQMYLTVKGNLKDLEQNHVVQVLELLNSTGCKRFYMKGIQFYTAYQWLYAVAENPETEGTTPTESDIEENTPKLCIEKVESSEQMGIKKAVRDCTVIYIDEDTVVGELKLRHRLPGDQIIPMGMSGHKKIKALLIDEKVPLKARDKVWLICDDEKIIWVYGMRQHAATSVTKNTRQILRLSLSDVVPRV